MVEEGWLSDVSGNPSTVVGTDEDYCTTGVKCRRVGRGAGWCDRSGRWGDWGRSWLNRSLSCRNRGRSRFHRGRGYGNRGSGGASLAGLGSLLLARLARLRRFGRRTVSRFSLLRRLPRLRRLVFSENTRVLLDFKRRIILSKKELQHDSREQMSVR